MLAQRHKLFQGGELPKRIWRTSMTLVLLFSAAAIAASPATYDHQAGQFLSSSGPVQTPEFNSGAATQLVPADWLRPDQQLVSWGVIESEGAAIPGLIWMEIDDSAGSPFLLFVSDRLEDTDVPDVGSGRLFASVVEGPDTDGDTWAPWVRDELVQTWNTLPDHPVHGPEEAYYSSESGLVVVILTGCPGTARPRIKVPGPNDNMDDLPEDPGPGPEDEPGECPAEPEDEESPTE